jgi:putative ABC transport system permease protein
MFKNYFKVALRTLWRQKFYTGLNVFGLSFGIAVGLILFQFIRYHLSFDRYHRNEEELYKIVTEMHLPDGTVQYDQGTPLALTKALKSAFPAIKNEAVLSKVKSATIGVQNPGQMRYFIEKNNIAFADQQWFHMFNYDFVEGNTASLSAPNTAVITQQLATKYFGTESPVGKTLRFDNSTSVTVAGTIKNYPSNTDFKIDMFLSRPSFKSFYPRQEGEMLQNWDAIYSTTHSFVQLPKNISVQKVETAITLLKQKHFEPFHAAVYQFHLQPVKNIHFDGRFGGTIRKSLLTTLACVAIFLVVIACFNFINLATAQSMKRGKEIGTRKVLGGTPSAIFWQFIAEITCIVFIAAILSVTWCQLFLPVVNNWLQTELRLDLIDDTGLLLSIAGLLVFVIIASGIYPALILSRFKPIEALKKQKADGRRTTTYRKGLVIIQNVIVQGLIICTLVITLQVMHLKNADLGFNKESVLMISIPDSDKGKMSYLKNELGTKPMIKSVSFCYQAPSSEADLGGSIKFDDRPWEDFSSRTVIGDAQYLTAFGLQLIAGKNLQESDTLREVLINQTLLQKLGFNDPQQVIGHQLVVGGLTDNAATIAGVVKDFNVHSLYTPMEPVVITTKQDSYRYAAVLLAKTSRTDTRDQIQKAWQSVYPENVFDYRYVDEQVDEFYQKEDLLSNLIKTTTVIAIIISCLGLLGLISFFTVQRTKEIGIRKVLGASVMDIVLMFSKDFIVILSLSIIITSPITYYFMNQWLQGFAYRININWWIFVLAALASMFITFFTIGIQSLKAASVNPSKSLKSE